MKQPRLQLPGAERRENERRSNAALAGASLLFHLALLMLFPGLAMPQIKPPVLLIELSPNSAIRPVRVDPASKQLLGLDHEVPAGMGARSLDPQDGQAAVRQSAPGSNMNPQRPAGAAGAIVPQHGQAAPSGPVSPQQPGPSSDVTDIVNAQPRVVPDSLQQTTVPPNPQAQDLPDAKPSPPAAQPDQSPQTRPADKPSETQPQGRPDQPGAPGIAKPAPETGKQDRNPNQGSGSGPSPDPGDGSGTTPGAPNNQGPEGRTAPDFGAPALPTGPGDGELAILGAYGDHCMNQIKRQARNPERAREHFKGKSDWGTVTFEFEVSKAGKLLDVRIVNDGGFAPLGAEVEEATRVAAQYFGSWAKYGAVASVDSWTFKRKLKFPLY